MTVAPLKFPRPLDDIIRDMERCRAPGQYDKLLAEWVDHPTIVARQAEYDAADAVVDKLDALLAEQNIEAIS